jgi:ATP phosphoribosyltransferase
MTQLTSNPKRRARAAGPTAERLTLALPKGRLREQVSVLFERAYGVSPDAALSKSRKLAWDAEEAGLRFLSVRASDIASYVEHGAADVGVVGLDVLREEGRDLYEPLDLKVGACKLVLAAPADRVREGDEDRGLDRASLAGLARAGGPLRVATKYPRLAAAHLARRGVASEMVALHGAIEIAPSLGVADVVVDITETGETLRQNGLVILGDVLPVTARLVVNRVSLKRFPGRVRDLVAALERAMKAP